MLTAAGLWSPLLLKLLRLLLLLPLLARTGTGAVAHSSYTRPPALHDRCLAEVEVPQPRHMHWKEREIAMRLQISDRPESQLTAWIFKLFLEEVLGYTRVELVNVPDNYNMTAYIRALTDCPRCLDMGPSYLHDEEELDRTEPKAAINLEVWAAPGYELEQDVSLMFDIMYAGPLGTVIRMGWFFQDWVATSHAAVLDHWRAFLHPEAMRVFNYTETELDELTDSLVDERTNRHYCDLPECVDGVFVPPWCQGLHCAVLLASRPEEVGFVLDQITYHRLHVRVYWVGDHLVRLATDRTDAGRPVLFVHYTPSLLTLRTKFVEVAFPAENTFGSRYLKKMAWNKLQDGAPMAEKALQAFQLTQQQYMDMLKLQLDQPASSPRLVACRWLRANANSSRTWEPNGRPQIIIGGIFPIGGNNYKAKGVIPAAVLAMQAVNSNASVLRDYDLTLMSHDGQCSTDMVMRSFINYVRLPEHKHMAGILGPACSDTVEPIAGVSRHYNVVVISYSAEGVLFSNRSQYPYFFRTIGENKQFRFVYKQLLRHMEWRRVAALTEDGQKYSEYISLLQAMIQGSDVTFITNRKFPRDTKDMEPYLDDLRKKNARIIIADLYEIAARAVMCEAYLKNMTARQGYVWFLPEWLPADWYNHTDSNGKHRCKPEDLVQALDGHLALSHAYFANDSDIMQEGITVQEWRRRYKEECVNFSVDESDYAGYAYDAVWTYALALDKLLEEKPSSFQNFHTGPTNGRFVEILKATDFNGVSGNIQFVGPSRSSIILVKQWRAGKYYVVGHFEPNTSSPEGGRLLMGQDRIQWLTPGGRRPVDGSSAPCDLQPLADLLNTTCENAMIAVNVMLLVIVLLVLVSCVLFYKRRYDQKVLRLRELGLANEVELRLDEWEVMREDVVVNRRLGEGAFGTVYGGEAMLPKDRHVRHGDRKRSVIDQKEADKELRSVAVKTLKLNYSLEEKLDFLSEAEVMKLFNHINIVQLLGVCTRSEPILTVMEYMLHGDLKTFLLGRRGLVTDKQFKDENNEVSNKRLTSMARDVACALSYLADRKYVHRDIACRNCLINAQHVVKLADFGMTRSMCENDYYRFNRKGMLPVRWMAPESLADGLFTPASDMWSYGVLLFEIVTFGSFPFQGLSNAQVLDQVRAGSHVTVPRGVRPELAELLLACWSMSPDKRPDAKAVVERLADYPRLISPCLDAPLSAVQLDGQNTHEVDLNSSRKLSLSLNGRPPGLFQRATSHELADIAESERLVNGGGGGGWPVPSSPISRFSPLHSLRDRRYDETTNV